MEPLSNEIVVGHPAAEAHPPHPQQAVPEATRKPERK